MLNSLQARLTRRLLLNAGLLAAAAASLTALAADQPSTSDLGSLIQSAETVLRGETSAAVVHMKVKKSTYERDYDLLILSDDRQKASKVFIRMLGPALWRGNATLKVGNRVSFFDPRTNRTTVMGSAMLADNWMGSHFTNDDLLRETDLSKHYKYEPMDLEATDKQSAIEGTHHRIRLTPLPDAPVSWGEVHYHLVVTSAKEVLPISLDYFRRQSDEKPERTLTYDKVEQMGGKTVPTRMTMTLPSRPEEFTRIEYSKLKFGMDLSADKFTERAFQ